jgi:hypothetical protein
MASMSTVSPRQARGHLRPSAYLHAASWTSTIDREPLGKSLFELLRGA